MQRDADSMRADSDQRRERGGWERADAKERAGRAARTIAASKELLGRTG